MQRYCKSQYLLLACALPADLLGGHVHIPDGFINATTSVGAGLVSLGGLSFALRRAREFVEENRAPLAGLLAAFVFALQMLNFPVAAGTSGHFMGGLLAAVLLGPGLAVLVMAVVLTMQSLLFADGGLTALGLNVLNLGLIGVLAGWVVFVGARQLMPARRSGIVVASGIAGAASVMAAALGFVAEYAIGGVGTAPVRAVGAAMVGVHALIGVGEGVITALAVGAVLSVRPDLVYGAQGLGPATAGRAASAEAGRP